MHGQEGANIGLSPLTDAKSHGGASITNGEMCQVQSNEYDMAAAAAMAGPTYKVFVLPDWKELVGNRSIPLENDPW